MYMYLFIRYLWKDGRETDGTVPSGEAGRVAFRVCPRERYTFWECFTYSKQFLGILFTRGTSRAVQWLRLRLPMLVQSAGSILGQGAKISHALQLKKAKHKTEAIL